MHKAGGKNTNLHGLSYELLTNLETEYTILKKYKHYSMIKFNNIKKVNQFIVTNKSNLFKYMRNKMNTTVPKAHGCKSPDECFINLDNKTMFIIEKKFQKVGGSVCEKVQTTDFKLWQYGRTFPEYKIVYIYCLSDWFKKNCPAELEYLDYKKYPYFWGDDKEYKTKIITFINNCK